jgi:hypothetical protein
MSSLKSFSLSRFPVPESVFFAIRSQLSQLEEKQRGFVLHVLVSNVLNLNKIHAHGLEGWIDLGVELPCQWIAEYFGSKFQVSAIDPDVLTFKNHSTEKHECRSFVAAQSLLDVLLGWSPKDVEGALNEPVVNLFDGKPCGVFAPKEWEHGIYTPKVIRAAITAFESCPFNFARLEEHLVELQDRVRLALNDDDRQHMERVLLNDKACAMRLRAGCKIGRDGLSCYQPEYRTSYTGRVIEVGGGAQSCSRAMKRALFEGVPGLKNYDLKRAQAFILLQELEDVGLPRDWIEKYVHTEGVNEERAAALGISKDSYKACLYATVMGALHTKHWNRRENEIYKGILDEECDGDAARAREITLKVYGALAPLKKEVDAWHDHLMKSDGCRRVDPIWSKVRTLKNACGQHFKLEGERTDKLARRAAAFILQGQEASFVHHLTVLGKDNGFIPISNQHDGLVVIGEIPTSAVEHAARQAGLRYATMDQKPFL